METVYGPPTISEKATTTGFDGMPDTYWSTKLSFVRHGQARSADGSYGNDTPLSRLGHEQARAIAATLAAETAPTGVYASPYPRAVETARPFCRRYEITPTVDPRLVEFELPTVAFEMLQERPDLALWRPDHCATPGGETLAAFSERVATVCTDIVLRHARASVAIFTHAGVIDAALRWAVSLPPDSAWQHDFDLAPGSITEIEVWPHGRVKNGAPRFSAISRVGDVSHLRRLVSDL